MTDDRKRKPQASDGWRLRDLRLTAARRSIAAMAAGVGHLAGRRGPTATRLGFLSAIQGAASMEAISRTFGNQSPRILSERHSLIAKRGSMLLVSITDTAVTVPPSRAPTRSCSHGPAAARRTAHHHAHAEQQRQATLRPRRRAVRLTGTPSRTQAPPECRAAEIPGSLESYLQDSHPERVGCDVTARLNAGRHATWYSA